MTDRMKTVYPTKLRLGVGGEGEGCNESGIHVVRLLFKTETETNSFQNTKNKKYCKKKINVASEATNKKKGFCSKFKKQNRILFPKTAPCLFF